MGMRSIGLALALAAAAVSVPQSAMAQQTQQVQFARGTSSAMIAGAIRGSQYIDYIVNAAAGQRMTVSLQTANGATYFNVTPPGSQTAIHNGSTSGNNFAGRLPQSGPTVIRVYMMRSAARRGEIANFRLTVSVAAAVRPPLPPATQLPAGRPSATASIPCAGAPGQPMGSCPAAVYRRSGGNATVVVTLGQGRQRSIVWAGGRASSSNARQVLRQSRSADLTIITIGAERYEIPDAFVFGG
jgi:hypothetical protein